MRSNLPSNECASLRKDRRLALEPLEDRRILAVVINELMYHPASEQVAEEYVELHNTGVSVVNLQGWRLAGVDFDFPDVSIPAGGYLVAAADVGAFSAKYPGVANVVGGWGGRLSNQGESLELRADSGAPADSITYADDGDWALRRRGPDDRGHQGWIWEAAHDGLGSSLELINAAMPNEHGHNWAASVVAEGTPGAANSVAATDIAPLIVETVHAPVIPTSTDSVTVVARVIDELSSVADVTLWHRVYGLEAFAPLAMTDDGAQGDGAAGDGLYGAVLPPQRNDAVVEFYVSATDQGGLTRTWPAATDDMGTQGANLLYQVLDAQPGGVLPTYQVIMTEAERAELEGINRFSDAQMNASFVSTASGQTEVRYNVGLRIRGSGSRTFNPPNYRVNIPADRPWQDVTQLNLNAVNPEQQVAGSALFAIAGLPAADALPVTVLTNGVDLMGGGFYAHVEALNSEWADRHFPTDGAGNVYRGRRPNESPPGGQGAGLVYFGPDPAPYVSYVKTSNESDADWSDVIGLTFSLNESPDETYLNDVSQVANIDQWLRTFALNAIIDNNEFGLFNGDRLGDDYAMYRGITDPRFQMVPHDLDTLFRGVNRPLFRERGVPALNRLVTHPDIVPRYYRQFIDLIENVMTAETLTPLLTAALGEMVSAGRIDQIRNFLLNRAQVVLSRIPTELTVVTDLPVVDGYPRTDGMFRGLLAGQASPVNTHTVLVNGVPTAWSPFDAAWQITAGTATGDEEVIVPAGSVWKYLDDGSDQKLPADGTAWFGHPDYDDSTWAEDAAQLGYGDGDEATVVSFGEDEETKHITTYFRRTFDVADAARFTSLRVRFLRDDGGAVYLNGQELFRSNLGEGADYETVALTFTGPGAESTFFDLVVPPDALVSGTNVLAVEVHQRSAASADMSFDLELLGFDPTLPVEGVLLQPGINRLTVRALDGQGREVERTAVDVWYDDSSIIDLPAVISANTTLSAADGPYRVSGDLTVQGGAELRIEGGATVYFEPAASLIVRGRLVAEGNDDARIRLTLPPGGAGAWNGIQLLDTAANNLLAYVDMDFADGRGESITAVKSMLTVDNMTWGGTDNPVLQLDSSSWRVTNSVLPGVATGAAIQAAGILRGGQAVIESNVFETASGEGDVIHFSGAVRTGPILQVLDNTLLGGGDDGLVLDGADAHVEGNTFAHFHQAVPGDDSSNAITTGGAPGAASNITVARNVFLDNDHDVLLREGSFLIGQHNTFVGSTISAINFDEPNLPGVAAGLGAQLDGNIFHENALVFENVVDGVTLLGVDRSVVPDEWIDLGAGNRGEDPRFVDDQGDFRLRPGSPALGNAAHGLDMGAMVNSGAAVSGEPPAVTHLTAAALSVGGAGITHYRYRVNGGAFGAEFAVGTPIVLSALTDGDYTVAVIGKNSAGVWQEEADATASRAWRVESGRSNLVISEVLADNRTAVIHAGTFPDLIELHNAGATTIVLSGMSLSDDPAQPGGFVFPAGLSLAPGQRLVVIAGEEDGTPGIHTGFALDQDGDGVHLYDQGGMLVDSVSFGLQLTDLSIGRSAEGDWGLARPTFGAANIAHEVGDRATLVINEWMTSGDRLFNDDFFELYNPDPLPVALGGLFLTDHPSGLPMRHEIAPLSFISGQDWRSVVADGRPENGADHVAFQLSAHHELIGLLDENLSAIDVIWYAAVPADVSQGRAPDGESQLAFFSIPSPGASNEVVADTIVNLVTFTDSWRYDDTGVDLGTAWRENGFDDSAWLLGQGVLHVENDPLPAPKGTELTIGSPTFYFRNRIHLTAAPDRVTLELTALVDDGAVFYINGVEVYRLGLTEGEEIVFSTLADRLVGDAVFEGPLTLDIPPGLLVEGDNLLAVEVHQGSAGSSDIVMGLSLDATIAALDPTADPFRLLDNLRITELMYHAAEGSQLDFVELQNTGSEPLNLAGVQLTDGIEFEFGETTLAPGQYIVLVSDVSAFRARYGNVATVAGEYSLNLSNGGERIQLQLPSPFDGDILDFNYDDGWHPTTDGDGYSLVIRNAVLPPETWNEQASWRPSGAVGGSPGFADPLLAVPGDTNGDGVVDVTDLNNVRNQFGGNGLGDTNGDGRVDIDDLNAVRNHFGAAGFQREPAAAADVTSTSGPDASLLARSGGLSTSSAPHSRAAGDGRTTSEGPRVALGADSDAVPRATPRRLAGGLGQGDGPDAPVWDLALLDWLRGGRLRD